MTPFLITIDVECDNAWKRGEPVSTRNSAFLPRFQALCEEFGFKPSYLVNYEMAECPVFQRFGNQVLERQTGEVGMHLHAWNNPPVVELTGADGFHHPYLIEYPEKVMREKIETITNKLKKAFGVRAKSHRAGRWALDERYAKLLVEYGYEVDCSITPHVSWRHKMGKPGGDGGTDYRNFPTRPYYMDLDDISREGHGPLLEVPMTILRDNSTLARSVRKLFGKLPGLRTAVHDFFPEVRWLRPDGTNRHAMIRVLRRCQAVGMPHVEFMLHSSEFMPGGSPTFKDENAVERLYDDLRAVFKHAAGFARGCTLSEFGQQWQRP